MEFRGSSSLSKAASGLDTCSGMAVDSAAQVREPENKMQFVHAQNAQKVILMAASPAEKISNRIQDLQLQKTLK
jgi:hypothetical protein